MKFEEILKEICDVGLRINPQIIEAHQTTLGACLTMLQESVEKSSGILKPTSSAQCAKVFEKLLPNEMKRYGKSGKLSIDANVLSYLIDQGNDVAVEVLDYRKKQKVLSLMNNVPKWLDKDNRVHPKYKIGSTGRVFFSDPSITTFPAEIRQAVIPDKGNIFLYADYDIAELMILAHLAGDKGFIESVLGGDDIHQLTAQDFGCSRDAAKVFHYAMIYGATPISLAQHMKVTEAMAEKYCAIFEGKHPIMISYLKAAAKRVVEKGGSISWKGRKMPYDITEGAKSVRRCVNHEVQGTCADIIAEAAVAVREKLNTDTRVKALVFDSMLIEVPEENVDEAMDLMKDAMESIGPYKMRVRVHKGRDWKEAWEDSADSKPPIVQALMASFQY